MNHLTQTLLKVKSSAKPTSAVRSRLLTPAAFARDESVDALRVPVHTVFHKFKACRRKKNYLWFKTSETGGVFFYFDATLSRGRITGQPQ